MPKGNSDRSAELHAASVVVIGHDHWADEAHLLSMQPAGLTAKILHLSVDADVWSGPEKMQASMHRYTGWTAPARAAIERVRRLAEARPDRLRLALTASDIERARTDGVSAVVLGFEGGKPIEQDLGLLADFHRRGLRVLQLTWAGGNDICDRRDEPACEGLTPFGRSVVTECNRLGILLDPGHCSRRTFDQVLELTSAPVAVLHATPSGAKPGAGDVSDEQLKALAQGGGVIGLHFFSHYLHPSRRATVADLVDHVDYVANLVGIDHVALGGDYFDLTEEFVKGHGPAPGGFMGIPPDLDSYEKLVNVTRELIERGYSDEHTKKVLGGNLLRVLRAALRG